MKKQRTLAVVTTALALATISGAGCLGMQSQTTLEAIQGTIAQPFVEAFIEYPGPQAKWAGPTSFVLHVVAKDSGNAQIAVSPALFSAPAHPSGTTTTTRTLASAQQPGMTGEQARDQMAHLATALQGADSKFAGCLSPVRVRLIRADGVVLEKQGCRGQNGWSRVTSETVNAFITASLYGVGSKPAVAKQ